MRVKNEAKKIGKEKEKVDLSIFRILFIYIILLHGKGYICMEILPDVPLERETRINPLLHFTLGKRLKYLFQNINYD